MNPSNVRVEIPLLKGSRFGDRAIVSGNLLQSEIVRGKKECLYKSLLEKMCLKLSPPPSLYGKCPYDTPVWRSKCSGTFHTPKSSNQNTG